MSLSLGLLAIDVAVIVCLALFAARVLVTHPRMPTAWLITAIGFNSICYVVLGRYDYGYWIPSPYQFHLSGLQPVLNIARNLTPGLFMILCFTLFSPRKRFPRWLLALFAVQMFLEAPIHWFVPARWPYAFAVTQTLPTVLQTLFGGFAIYWAISEWRGDLVESRRRTRAVVLLVIALNIIASSLLLRLVIDPNTIANYYTHEALLALNLVIVAFLLLQEVGDSIRPYLEPAPAPLAVQSPSADRADAAALAELTRLLEREQIYREANLSVKGLADRVGLPEYRMRRLIHERLGYQNFNAFLHDYRIKDACRQLGDPAMRRIPILTIALSVGYQSVNTFNRGFRDIMVMTPSAYRAHADQAQATGKITPDSQ